MIYNEFDRQLIHEKFQRLTNLSNDNPRRNIVYAFHPPGEIHAYHKHCFCEVNVILKGSGINNINGESLKMEKGDAMIIHPEIFHQLYIDENSVAVNFLIYPEFLISVLNSADPCSPIGEFVASCKNDEHGRYILYKSGSDDTSLCEELINTIKENIENHNDNLFKEEGLFLLFCSL